LIRSKLGVCWDQTELERLFFNQYIEIPYLIYYIQSKNENAASHTFLEYMTNNKFYWFEHSWYDYRGIHEFKSHKELISHVTKIHTEYHKCSGFDMYVLDRPKYGISCQQFMDFAVSGKKIMEK